MIYYWVKDDHLIDMLVVYPKPKKGDLTDRETALARTARAGLQLLQALLRQAADAGNVGEQPLPTSAASTQPALVDKTGKLQEHAG